MKLFQLSIYDQSLHLALAGDDVAALFIRGHHFSRIETGPVIRVATVPAFVSQSGKLTFAWLVDLVLV